MLTFLSQKIIVITTINKFRLIRKKKTKICFAVQIHQSYYRNTRVIKKLQTRQKHQFSHSKNNRKKIIEQINRKKKKEKTNILIQKNKKKLTIF